MSSRHSTKVGKAAKASRSDTGIEHFACNIKLRISMLIHNDLIDAVVRYLGIE